MADVIYRHGATLTGILQRQFKIELNPAGYDINGITELLNGQIEFMNTRHRELLCKNHFKNVVIVSLVTYSAAVTLGACFRNEVSQLWDIGRNFFGVTETPTNVCDESNKLTENTCQKNLTNCNEALMVNSTQLQKCTDILPGLNEQILHYRNGWRSCLNTTVISKNQTSNN